MRRLRGPIVAILWLFPRAHTGRRSIMPWAPAKFGLGKLSAEIEQQYGGFGPIWQENNSPSHGGAVRILKKGEIAISGTMGVASEFSRAASAKLFPLHLAPIDAFFVTDDTPRYPMTSFIHLDFTGQVERGAWDGALEEALERHPLARAVIRRAKGDCPCWVIAPEIYPEVDWGTWDVPLDTEKAATLDLVQSSGIRFWVRVGENRSRIVLQVHHGCTDGTGVYRFLGDLLAAYGQRTGHRDAQPKMMPLDATLLRYRRRKMAGKYLDGNRSQLTWSALREGWSVFGHSIAPVAPPRVDYPLRDADVLSPGICAVEFLPDEHQALRQVAATQGAMLNDLLLAEMFRSVGRWNEEQGSTWGDPRLRIMMPFDMRGQHDHSMPAANMTSYTFLTRRVSACRNLDELLKGIRQETSGIKLGREGSAFMDAVMVSQRVPWLLPLLLRRNRCLASLTLSNVGDPSKRFTATFPRIQGRVQCGNLLLDRVLGVPPLRQKMHATLAVFTYLRRLTVCLRCDPRVFSEAATQALLNTYADGLRAHVDSRSSQTPSRPGMRRSA